MNRTFYDATEQLVEALIVIQRDMYGFFSYLRDRAYLYFKKVLLNIVVGLTIINQSEKHDCHLRRKR